MTPDRDERKAIAKQLMMGGAIAILAGGIRIRAPKLNKDQCVQCGAKMPPGRAGRSCKGCRQ